MRTTGGVLHCDIKAANVIVTGRNQAKVLDFGLSRAVHLPGEDGAKIGTLPYMPPDRIIDNTLDEQGDLLQPGRHALRDAHRAASLHRRGRAWISWRRSSRRSRTAPSTLVPGHAEQRWIDIVARALAKDPRQRFQSAREFDRGTEGRCVTAQAARRGRRSRVRDDAVGACCGLGSVVLPWLDRLDGCRRRVGTQRWIQIGPRSARCWCGAS